MLHTVLVFSALVALLVSIAGVLMVIDKRRTLRSFGREITIPLRGLLAFFVLTAHMVPGLYSIALPSVAMFFFLSGYGLCMSFKNKSRDYLKGFLKNRFSKLLPAFVTLTIMTVLLAILIDRQSLTILLRQIAILPHSWFIYAIIYVYVVFYISAILGKTLRRTGYLLICFIMLYIFLIREVGHWDYFWYTNIPAVIFGYYFAMYDDHIERLVMRHTLGVYLSAVALVLLSAYGKIKLILLIHSPFEIWLGFWGISIALACYLIIRSLGAIKWKPLVWLGTISMEVYLVHGLLLMYIGKALSAFDSSLDELIYYIVYVILGYILSIFAAWTVHNIFNRHTQ